jgi:hypothetical protein
MEVNLPLLWSAGKLKKLRMQKKGQLAVDLIAYWHELIKIPELE